MNVLYRALPAGVTDYLAMLGAILVSSRFGIPAAETSTMTTIVIGGSAYDAFQALPSSQLFSASR